MAVELAVAFAVTVLSTPVIRRALADRGVLDVPNERSSHIVPVPRGGGLACSLGVLIALAFAYATRDTTPPWPTSLGVMALAALGFEDDRRGLSARVRLVAQVAVGALVGTAIGGPWWTVLGIACLPVAVNVVNFMDGINGITGLNVGCWGLVAAALGNTYHAEALTVLGAATAGAAFGFLPWNAPRARVFLGDSGSYLLGALVGTGVLVGVHSGVPGPVLIAPLSVYLADTGSTLARRAIRREALMSAHREHVYQRLVADARLSHVTVAVLTAALSLVVTATWWLGGSVAGFVTTLCILGFYVAFPDVLRRTRNGRVHDPA